MTDREARTRERVEEALKHEAARVDSPEAAEAVAREIEHLAAGETEQTKGEEARRERVAPAEAVERVAQATDPTREAAAVLAQAAAEVVAPKPEAADVLEGALRALGPEAYADSAEPEVERGRRLLRDAVLHRMGRFGALDARIYLAINGFPHPPWSDKLAVIVTFWTTGGWIWAGAVLVARLFQVPSAGRALLELLPSVAGATWIVEHPVKAVFRRRRPFIDNVRALVVGKKPGSWSFPSGHTASSFACAWVLTTIWPRLAPLFYALASGVGFSRIYVGAHYPGDVASGALFGTALAELIRRPIALYLKRRRVQDI
jgi:membrane-associated phospholipid phosphatase